MGQGQARPAGAGPRPPGQHAGGAGPGLQQPNEDDAAAARRRSVGTWGNGAEGEDEEGQGPAPLDFGDEASVVVFMRQKYACVEGGRCPR